MVRVYTRQLFIKLEQESTQIERMEFVNDVDFFFLQREGGEGAGLNERSFSLRAL